MIVVAVVGRHAQQGRRIKLPDANRIRNVPERLDRYVVLIAWLIHPGVAVIDLEEPFRDNGRQIFGVETEREYLFPAVKRMIQGAK